MKEVAGPMVEIVYWVVEDVFHWTTTVVGEEPKEETDED